MIFLCYAKHIVFDKYKISLFRRSCFKKDYSVLQTIMEREQLLRINLLLIIFPTKTCVLPPVLFGLFIFFSSFQEKYPSFPICHEWTGYVLSKLLLLMPDWTCCCREVEAPHPLASSWRDWLRQSPTLPTQSLRPPVEYATPCTSTCWDIILTRWRSGREGRVERGELVMIDCAWRPQYIINYPLSPPLNG